MVRTTVGMGAADVVRALLPLVRQYVPAGECPDLSGADAVAGGTPPRDLAAELRETAAWLDERAESVEEVAAGFAGGPRSVGGERRLALRTEATKLRGRAGLIRVLVANVAAG